MKTKTIIKRLLVLCCIVAALALAAFAGYLIYDHVGYKPFGSIEDDDIDTGYYLDVASETFRIMKDGVRTYYMRVDGVLYDIRDELIYTDLRDYSRGIINSYDREYN